jgi:hypothetical protein
MAQPNDTEDWLEELEKLVPQVKRWFREATSKLTVPSDADCRAAAIYLIAFRESAKSANNEQRDSRKDAIRYGKLFLKHIEPERRRIEKMISAASHGTPYGDWLPQYQDRLRRIEEIRGHMAVLLPALSPDLDHKWDPIRKLASIAQEAWERANNGRSPRSKNPDDPLCLFLVKALTAIGEGRSPAEITEVLRRRRRTRPGGQI